MDRQLYPIYIVDDEQSVLDSMKFMLESYGYQVQAFSRGRAFLDAADLRQVGCVILDSRMPDLRGQDVHKILNEQHSPLGVIYLTGHGDIPMAVNALQAGADHFFQKPVDSQALVQAIDSALLQSEQQAVKLAKVMMLKQLTAREHEVLQLIVTGLKNQQMADKLCVSLRTVEVHRSNVMKKLKVTSVAALIHKVGDVL